MAFAWCGGIGFVEGVGGRSFGGEQGGEGIGFSFGVLGLLSDLATGTDSGMGPITILGTEVVAFLDLEEFVLDTELALEPRRTRSRSSSGSVAVFFLGLEVELVLDVERGLGLFPLGTKSKSGSFFVLLTRTRASTSRPMCFSSHGTSTSSLSKIKLGTFRGVGFATSHSSIAEGSEFLPGAGVNSTFSKFSKFSPVAPIPPIVSPISTRRMSNTLSCESLLLSERVERVEIERFEGLLEGMVNLRRW